MGAARNLGDAYGRLGVSTRRLSSGLRIGTAADDARRLGHSRTYAVGYSDSEPGHAQRKRRNFPDPDRGRRAPGHRRKTYPNEGTGGTGFHRYLQLDPARHHRLGIPGHGLGNHPYRNGHGLQRHLPAQRAAFRNAQRNGAGLHRQSQDPLRHGATTRRKTIYYITIGNSSASALGVGLAAGNSVSTQELAQASLDRINAAIVSKDKIRAHLGAMQNRLEKHHHQHPDTGGKPAGSGITNFRR